MDTVSPGCFESPVFGVARQDDAIDGRGARCRANEIDQLPNLLLKMLTSPEGLGIEQQEEDAIAFGIKGRFASRAASRERSGEDVDDHSESESLVSLLAAEGEDRAGRLPIEDVRVGGGTSFGIEQPSFGATRPGDLVHAHFSFGGNAGAEIEHEWVGGGGNAVGDGVRPQPWGGAAGRSHAPSGTVRVGHEMGYKTGLRDQLAILAQASDMTGVTKCRGDDTCFLDALECLVEQPSHLDASESPVPIGGDRSASVLEDGQLDAGGQLAFPKHLEVKGDPHDAVGGVPQSVGKRQTRADDGRIFGGDATLFEQRGCSLGKFAEGNVRHGWLGEGMGQLAGSARMVTGEEPGDLPCSRLFVYSGARCCVAFRRCGESLGIQRSTVAVSSATRRKIIRTQR